MNVGLIGTGAIAQKHGDCYKELGFNVAAASDIFEEKGRKFVAKYGGEFVADWRDVALLAGLGFFQLGIPCAMMVVAARHLSATELALLALLEVLFGKHQPYRGASAARPECLQEGAVGSDPGAVADE